MRRLTLSDKDKMLFGVVGGISEYFETDSGILRVGWILLVISTGIFPGVIAYILMAAVMPRKAGS